MTTNVAMMPHSDYTSGSESPSRSGKVRRTMSLPDMIPPTVTTDMSSMNSSSRNRQHNMNVIPTLETKALSFDGKYEPFPLNSETPIPIETDLFSGRLLMICRPATNPAEVDPYWNERIFSKKRRRVVLQLQGKLKYKPAGTIYAGMEISDPMKLGLIANGLCSLILKLIRDPTIHYSFGSTTERAHICFPASTFFQTFIVTPPGEIPPEIGGVDLDGEPPDVAAARKAYKTKINWNTEDTYTMSFHSMFVDFPSWSVVSLPIGKDVSLQTFWGNSVARVVLYEVDKDQVDSKPHLFTSLKYLLGVQLKSVAAAARSNTALLEKQDSEEDEEEFSELEGDASASASTSTVGDMALMPAFDEEDSDIDPTMFFDTIESLPYGDSVVDGETMDVSSVSSHNTLLSIIDSFCPCWIDMFSKRGKYETLYAFCGTKRPIQPLFRTFDMVTAVFKDNRQEIAEVDDRFSLRVSHNERIRRIFGLKYAKAHTKEKSDDDSKNQMKIFHRMPCRFNEVFLKKIVSTAAKIMGDYSGIVARALSDRHWREERMVLLGESGDLLFHHVDSSRAHFRILLSSVIKVSTLTNASDLVPLPSYYYLQIETYVGVTVLMFSSAGERNRWFEELNEIMRDRSTRLYASDLLQYEIPMDEFLSKSTMWNCQKRKILNFRRYSFRTPRSKPPKDTLQLAERALTKVLALKPKGANDSNLRDFLDCAAALKEADAHSLNEEGKIAFFLNVYHIMIMHAFIILGPPVSGTEWISYFNNITYQCSDDIFSLAELEHNIIRAQMSYPSNFLSRFVLPKSQYHFAFLRPDFRLNFALNSGSLSMPTSIVPVYKAATLNDQLNNITKEFVGYTVHVRQKGKNDIQISLPRVCQWFVEDFGPNASASDIIASIEPYLSEEKRDALRVIWNAKKKSYEIGMFGVKYLSFNYECRFLTSSIK